MAVKRTASTTKHLESTVMYTETGNRTSSEVNSVDDEQRANILDIKPMLSNDAQETLVLLTEDQPCEQLLISVYQNIDAVAQEE